MMSSSCTSTIVLKYAESDDDTFRENRSWMKCNERIWCLEIRSDRLKLYCWMFFSLMSAALPLTCSNGFQESVDIRHHFAELAAEPQHGFRVQLRDAGFIHAEKHSDFFHR